MRNRTKFVVQDTASCQRHIDPANLAEMLEFLRKSRADIETGHTELALDALERLAKKHKL